MTLEAALHAAAAHLHARPADADCLAVLRAPCEAARGKLSHLLHVAVRRAGEDTWHLLRAPHASPLPALCSRSIGWGHALELRAEGPTRFADLKRAGQAALNSLRVFGSPAAEVLPPFLVGGFAFSPKKTPPTAEAQWHPFPDACFVLPRWNLLCDEQTGQGTLQLALRLHELAALDPILAELAALQDALADDREPPPAPDPPTFQRSTPAPAAWHALMEQALGEITAGTLHKIVLSRRTTVLASTPPSIPHALCRLADRHPLCLTFAFAQKGQVFFGATPERLVHKVGQQVYVDALAGSLPRETTGHPVETARHPLLSHPKEQREHALVVQAICDALTPLCQPALEVPAPRIRALPTVDHLHTPIAGTLRAQTHSLDLVQALHPTPAVGGVPTAAAQAFLAQHEPHERGWYAGPLGWFSATGDGDFWVGIRSALADDRTVQVYAGAGIVQGSVASAEYDEITAKQRTILSALGAEEA